MPKFRTAYDPLVVSSESGCAFEPVYSSSFDDSGVLVLEITGKRNIQEEIDSYKDSVDIYQILARYNAGDLDALSRVQGFYEDVSDLPRNYQEVLNSVQRSEDFFDSLPVEDKNKFNNSFSEFMVALGRKDFMDVYYPVEDVVPVIPDSDDIKLVSDDSGNSES